MNQLYDHMEKKEREGVLSAAKEAGISAGEWGTVMGALGQLAGGDRSWRSILLRGLGSGVALGGLGAGSTMLGSALLGAPSEDEPAGYTERGSIGGALGGGLLGAGAGYLMGTGKLAGLKHIPHAGKIAAFAKKALPLDNLVTDFLKKKMLHPSREGGLMSGAALGGLGAVWGGMHGASEGMGTDALRNLQSEEDQYAAKSPSYAG